MNLSYPPHNRILIIGASGFIGNTLYKELLPYFDVYGTYARQQDVYKDNNVFFQFNVEEDSILNILKEVKPNVIISCFKGPHEAILKAHQLLCDYIWAIQGKLVLISSASVFDAKGKYPSYENDVPLSESLEGKHKIALEKKVKELPEEHYCIARLPIILGVNSTWVQQLKQAIKHQAAFEVHPNWVVSVNTEKKVAQQIHYLINQHLHGIYHLASEDVSHHDDIFKEISRKLSFKSPIFKNVFHSNEDRYLAILPKENKLPQNYRITIEEVISDSTLKDEITTLKK